MDERGSAYDDRYRVLAFNRAIRLAEATGMRGSNPTTAHEEFTRELKEDHGQHSRLEGDKVIVITRRDDSASFKEFLVELKKPNAKTVQLR